MNIALHLTDVLASNTVLSDDDCTAYRFITCTLRRNHGLLRTKHIFKKMLLQVHDIIGKDGEYIVKLEITKMGAPHLHYLYRLPGVSRRIAALDSIRKLRNVTKYGGLILGYTDIKALKTHGDVLRVFKYIKKEMGFYTELLAPVKLSPLYNKSDIVLMAMTKRQANALKRKKEKLSKIMDFFPSTAATPCSEDRGGTNFTLVESDSD